MPTDPAAMLAASPPAVTPEQAVSIATEQFGLSGTATPLGGERDRNFLLLADEGRFALKVANPSEAVGTVAMQQAALEHVAITDPDVPIPRVVRTRSGRMVAEVAVGAATCAVRMVTFLPGEILGLRDTTDHLRSAIAALLARLDVALVGFDHPGLRRPFLWDLGQARALRRFTHYLEPEHRVAAERWIDLSESEVVPRLWAMRAQAIHGDCNGANVVVDPNDATVLLGLIDFGDMVHGPLVMDPAVAAAYQSMTAPDPVAAAAHLMGSYHARLPLTDTEIEVAGDLIVGRLVQSITIAAWRAQLHPENRSYILYNTPAALGALRRFEEVGRAGVAEAIRRACERSSD